MYVGKRKIKKLIKIINSNYYVKPKLNKNKKIENIVQPNNNVQSSHVLRNKI